MEIECEEVSITGGGDLFEKFGVGMRRGEIWWRSLELVLVLVGFEKIIRMRRGRSV